MTAVEVSDDPLSFERVAGIDVGKAELMCCVRVPNATGRRRAQEVFPVPTMTANLAWLAQRLLADRVELVIMEATSDYWKTVHAVLAEAGLTVWLVNATQVKHLPGRPKTDKQDAVWLAKVGERGMARPSFVPPPRIAELRDLTRYRANLVTARTAEKERVEKLLDGAGIKLSVVASDQFGVSGTAILTAIAAGQTNPAELVKLLRGTLVRKRAQMIEALTGRVTAHHQFLLARMLARINSIDADITALDTRIAAHVKQYCQAQAEALVTIPGISVVLAAAILAEIGIDMTVFPTAKHLCAWARFTPVVNISAGRARGTSSTGKGNRYLGRALGEAANAAARTKTYLAARHRRLAHRRGKKRAVVATGRHLLTIIWNLLGNPDTTYHDLGRDYQPHPATRSAKIAQAKALLRECGLTATIQPAH